MLRYMRHKIHISYHRYTVEIFNAFVQRTSYYIKQFTHFFLIARRIGILDPE